jgi:hypothetical protein
VPSDVNEYMTQEEKIQKVISTFDHPFKLVDLIEALGKHNYTIPKNTISAVMFRLKKNNKVKVIKEGIGRSPAVYSR